MNYCIQIKICSNVSDTRTHRNGVLHACMSEYLIELSFYVSIILGYQLPDVVAVDVFVKHN